MSTQTMMQLRELKLGGMANALQTQLEQVGTYEGLPFIERLGLLLDQENLSRQQRKQERLIRQAHFRLQASVQEIDYQHPRNIMQSQMAQLAQGDWINRAQNLLITGPCGSGKTYLACALGHNACLYGYSVRYYRLSRLLLALTQAKADGSYHKQLKQLSRIQCLIIDDWGLEPLKPAHRNDLMEIMDDRHGHTSTVMISQLPTEQWYIPALAITPSQMPSWTA
jgi:DNA replication protein DnaC